MQFMTAIRMYKHTVKLLFLSAHIFRHCY